MIFKMLQSSDTVISYWTLLFLVIISLASRVKVVIPAYFKILGYNLRNNENIKKYQESIICITFDASQI